MYSMYSNNWTCVMRLFTMVEGGCISQPHGADEAIEEMGADDAQCEIHS